MVSRHTVVSNQNVIAQNWILKNTSYHFITHLRKSLCTIYCKSICTKTKIKSLRMSKGKSYSITTKVNLQLPELKVANHYFQKKCIIRRDSLLALLQCFLTVSCQKCSIQLCANAVLI